MSPLFACGCDAVRVAPVRHGRAATNLSRFAGVLFQQLTGTQFQLVHYRGAAPAMQDSVAGHIDISITAPVLVPPQARSGGVKAYAVTADSRLPSAAAIPTAQEAELPGFPAPAMGTQWASCMESDDASLMNRFAAQFFSSVRRSICGRNLLLHQHRVLHKGHWVL